MAKGEPCIAYFDDELAAMGRSVVGGAQRDEILECIAAAIGARTSESLPSGRGRFGPCAARISSGLPEWTICSSTTTSWKLQLAKRAKVRRATRSPLHCMAAGSGNVLLPDNSLRG